MLIANRIAVVLRVCSIADNKQLNVLVQTRASPKTIALVAIYLIKGFTDVYATTLQLNVDKW